MDVGAFVAVANTEIGFRRGRREAVFLFAPVLFRECPLLDQSGQYGPPFIAFMNKFRKLGFIDYNGSLKVNSALLNVVVHD